MPFGNFQYKPMFQAKKFTPQDYIVSDNRTQEIINQQKTQDLQSFLRNNYLRSLSDYINGGKQFNDSRRIYRIDEDPYVQQNFLERLKKNPYFTQPNVYDAMKSNVFSNKTARLKKNKNNKKQNKLIKNKYFS